MIKIYTNLKQLNKSGEYLKTRGVDFKYIGTNVFSLCQYNPSIIISNDKEEMEGACALNYPLIRFIGKNLNPPCESINIPDNFLYDVPSIKSIQHLLGYIEKTCDISYISDFSRPCTTEDMGFYYKLNYLGNTKLVGNISNINQVASRLSENEIYKFCLMGKVCALREDDKNFLLPILYLNTPCITDFEHPYCYHIDEINTVDLKPIDGQVEYARKFCVKSFWDSINIT